MNIPALQWRIEQAKLKHVLATTEMLTTYDSMNFNKMLELDASDTTIIIMVAIRQFKLPELYSVRNASSIQ
jgi:hypothetical protein